MTNPIGWLSIVATALLLQACAERPPASTARVFAADMAGAARSCNVSKAVPAAGQQVPVTMKLGNDGGWCGISVDNAGRPYSAGLLTAEPAHGTVQIHTVGDNTRIDYTPDRLFGGSDSFVVRLLPGEATLRVAVTVGPS